MSKLESRSEISCRNCMAACCKNKGMELTLDEASFMVRGGTKLVTIAQPDNRDRDDIPYPLGIAFDETNPNKGKLIIMKGFEHAPLPAGLGRYMMVGACGYLKKDETGWEYCGAYEDRPAACREYEVGDIGCRTDRVRDGIDEPTDGVPDFRNLILSGDKLTNP